MYRLAKILVIALTFFFAVCVPSAYAIPTLRLTSGATIIEIEDGGGLDSYPIAGVVTYIGSVGIFNINVTTGLTYPIVGSLEYPSLDLNDVSVSGAGSLKIEFSATDFGPTGYSDFFTAVGGVADGPVTFATYLNNSNTLFGTETLLGFLADNSNSAFSGETTTSLFPSDLFSLTAIATITHTGAQQVSSYDLMLMSKSNTMPEPASFLLLLTGGALSAGKRYLRRHRKV